MSERVVVERIEAVEWYDGIVSGFVHSNGRIFLCLLLAFDADARRRRYALLSVNETAGPSPTLDRFAKFVEAIFENNTVGSAAHYLTSDEPMPNAAIEIKKATPQEASNVSRVRIPCIDQAVLRAARDTWLS